MQDEVRLMVQCVDLIRRGLEGRVDVGVGWLVESDVAVADLDKSEVLRMRFCGLSAQQPGCRHTARKAPHYARSSPLHALQESAPVDIASKNTRHAFPIVSFCLSHLYAFLRRRE